MRKSLPFNPKNTSSVDPNTNQTGSRFGDTGDRKKRGEFATVITYHTDTYTCTLRTERGRTLSGVQQLRSTPNAIVPLEPGTEVLITYDYGAPLILGCVAMPAGSNTDDTPFSVTGATGFGGTGFNRSQNPEHGTFRQANEPVDLMPGDFSHITPDGNLLGILRGGVNVLKSSALAQIRTHLLNDLVEVISRNYKHITDMGIFEVTNNDGRINMSFRGGTDQRSEAGPDEEKWSVRFDLGSEGDIFNFEITTPVGQTLFRLHVDADGHCEIFGINGVTVNSGSQAGGVKSEENTGSKRTVIGGNNSEEIEGTDTKTVTGPASVNTLSDYEITAGNDYRVQSFRDLALGVGRNMNVAVMGNIIGDALVFDVQTGNFVVNVGELISPLGEFNVTTYQGNTTFTSELGGNFVVRTLLGNVETTSKQVKMVTTLPDSVILGGSGTLISHLAKFEQLASYINALHRALDSHVHDLTTGPIPAVAGPFKVIGSTGRPLIPISAPLTSLVPLIKSIFAGVGG